MKGKYILASTEGEQICVVKLRGLKGPREFDENSFMKSLRTGLLEHFDEQITFEEDVKVREEVPFAATVRVRIGSGDDQNTVTETINLNETWLYE